MSNLPEQERVLEVFMGENKILSTDHATYSRRLAYELKRRLRSETGELPVVKFMVPHDISEPFFRDCPVTGQQIVSMEGGVVVVRPSLLNRPHRMIGDDTSRY